VRDWIPACVLGGLAVLMVVGAAVGISRGLPPESGGALAGGQARSAEAEPSEFVGDGRYEDLRHLADLELPRELSVCGQLLPLDDPEVREALRYELLLTLGRPMMPLLWLRRAPEHLPRIERRLAEGGLPDDLKYVAVVESDLRSWTESPAGALGLWQIMRATGQRYGLRIDRYLDERLAAERSDEAAMAYLEDLHEEFEDWWLALAAYNAGHNALRRTLAEDDSRSYFEIYLPRETRRYVLRIAAAKLVMTAPNHYGLPTLPPPVRPELREVQVEVEQVRKPVKEIASDYGVGYGVLRRLNPQLVSRWLPRGEHRLRLPAEDGEETEPHS
jgi:hypothetical protein